MEMVKKNPTVQSGIPAGQAWSFFITNQHKDP